MSETYQVVRHNRYWHVTGEGSCGSIDPDAADSYLGREGTWDELAETLESDPAQRCSDCTFPDE